MASQMGIEDMSLAKLFANFFRQRISKNAQLSNWEADALDENNAFMLPPMQARVYCFTLKCKNSPVISSTNLFQSPNLQTFAQ